MSSGYIDLPVTSGGSGGAGVSSLNGLTGALALVDSANTLVDVSGSTLSVIVQGSADTFAGFDATGTLASIPNWTFDPLTGAGNANITLDPAAGYAPGQVFRISLNPTADNSNGSEGVDIATLYAIDNTSFNTTAGVDGLQNAQINGSNGELDYMRAFWTQQVAGDNSSTGTIQTMETSNIEADISAGFTVNNGSIQVLRLNNNGILSGSYQGTNHSFQGNAIGGGLIGVNVNTDIDSNSFTAYNYNISGNTVANSSILQGNIEGTVGQDLLLISMNNNSTVTGRFSGVLSNNNGAIGGDYQAFAAFNNSTVGGLYQGVTIGNNSSSNITGDYQGVNIYNSAPVAGNMSTAYFSNNQDVGLNYYGLNVSQDGNVGGTTDLISGSFTGVSTGRINGVDINIEGSSPAGATGVTVNMSTFTSPIQNVGLNLNDCSIQADGLYDTSVLTPAGGEFQINGIGGEIHIASGFPVADGSFGFGNNLGVTVLAEDDFGLDSSGIDLGFSVNGFVNQISVAAGKTFHTLNYMLAGGGIAPGSGSVTNLSLFRALGFLPEGGSLAITNLYGFKADAFLDAAGATNTWGIYVAAVSADNYFAKNVVVGGVTGHPTGAFALDVTGNATVSGSLVVGAGATGMFTTVDLKTVTVVSGIITSIA